MTASKENTLSAPAERILEETRLKLALAREHAESLADYGLTAEWLDALATDIDAAVAIPSFEQQRSELHQLTATKDAKLEACTQWARQLRFRFAIVANVEPAANTLFPSRSLTQAERNESKLIALMPTLLQLARTHAPALAAAGQTEATLTQGDRLLADLIAANQAQEEYNLNRTAITAARRNAFNKLYDAVNRINQTGQLVYGPTSATGKLFASHWRRKFSSPATAFEPEATSPSTQSALD